MWYRRRIAQDNDITDFKMPVLNTIVRGEEGSLSIGRNVERIERDAYERGFEAGEKAGFAMGEQKALVLIKKLETIIGELTTLRETLLKELEPQIVELAVSIARKIIIRELTANPDGVVEMTKEAVMKLERTGRITIKINSSLYDLFMKHKPDILSIHPDIVFDLDSSISEYGSVVMGPLEEVVTDLDEQMKNLIKEMGDKVASN